MSCKLRLAFTLCLIGLSLLPWKASLATAPLIADISRYSIHIDSEFEGTRLLLFGIQNDPGNVISTIRGPRRTITVRKKERVFGLWMNTDYATFADVPLYYSHSQETPAVIERSVLRHDNDWVLVEASKGADIAELKSGLTTNLAAQGLVRWNTEPINYMGQDLFKHFVILPDTAPSGSYVAEVALYAPNSQSLTGLQTLPVRLEKAGFEAFLSNMAVNHSWLYGLICVLIAVIAGTLANLIFSRL